MYKKRPHSLRCATSVFYMRKKKNVKGSPRVGGGREGSTFINNIFSGQRKLSPFMKCLGFIMHKKYSTASSVHDIRM